RDRLGDGLFSAGRVVRLGPHKLLKELDRVSISAGHPGFRHSATGPSLSAPRRSWLLLFVGARHAGRYALLGPQLAGRAHTFDRGFQQLDQPLEPLGAQLHSHLAGNLPQARCRQLPLVWSHAALLRLSLRQSTILSRDDTTGVDAELPARATLEIERPFSLLLLARSEPRGPDFRW